MTGPGGRSGRAPTRRGERGTATVELVGFIPFLFLAALAAWQILLVSASATAAQDAARTGSRAAGIGRDGRSAAVSALSGWLRDDARAAVSGTRTTVTVRVPILVPGLTTSDLTVSRTAELPKG